jgi:hypothetical protein
MRNLRVSLVAAVALSMLLASCAAVGSPPPGPSFEELAVEALGGLPGVALVELTQTPIGDANAPDPSDPDLWDIALGVTVTEQATVEEVVAAAKATADFSGEQAGKGPWLASVAVENIDHLPDDDLPSRSPAAFEVYPSVRVSAAADAREVMELLGLPGVESVSITEGFPSVTVAAATDLAAAREFASTLVLWRGGGSIWAEEGRVRLMDVPDRLTDEGMSLVIATSVAYPTAQFWLEALRVGPRWPRLYIDQVTIEDAAAITADLTDPAMPAAMVNEYELEFVIRANAADGTTVDSGGVVGSRT